MFINRVQIQHKYDQYQKFKDFKPGIGSKDFLKVFPFQIITGGYLTTNSGFKGLNSYVNDYNDLALIFSGQEAITAEWRESVTIKKIQDESDPTNPNKNYLERKRNIGQFFEGMRVNHYQSQQISIYAPSEKFQKEVIARTFKCLFQINRCSKNDNKTNNQIIEEFVKYQFDFFAAPELAKEFESDKQKLTRQVFPETYGKNGDLIQWSHTLYRPIAMDFYYDGKKDVIAVEINFASINDFMSNSGLAIQQYVNFGCPGQGYSFPKINQISQDVELDNNTIHANPVTHAQIDFYGVAAINAVAFFGYESNEIVNKDGSVTERIFAPSEIFFDGKFQKPIYDNTKQKALATENYYYINNAVPDIVTQWKKWQDIIAAHTFNPFYQKHYEGYLKLTNTAADVKKTNFDTATSKYKYTITDESFLKFLSDGTTKISKDYSGYSGIFNNNMYFQGNKLGLQDFSQYKNVWINGIHNSFLKNHILNSNIHELPVNIESSLAISESINISIGSVLGKFIPFAGFFGAFLNQKLPLGFRIGKNTPKSHYPGFDFIISAPIFDLAVAVAAADYIPLDYFRQGTNDALLIMGGQNSTTTSFLGSLTNNVTLFPFKDSDNTIQNVETKKSYFVGQENVTKDSHYFYTPDSEVRPRDNFENGYIITGFSSKGLAKTDYRLSYFNKPWSTEEKEVNNDDMIYMSYHKTKSNFSNNMFLWETKIIHGNPFFDIEKKFIFPKAYDPSSINKTVLVPDIKAMTKKYSSDKIPNYGDIVNPIQQKSLLKMSGTFDKFVNHMKEFWKWTSPTTTAINITIPLNQTKININALSKNIEFVEFQKDFIFDNINFYPEVKYHTAGATHNITYQRPKYLQLNGIKIGKDILLNKKSPRASVTIPINYDIYCIGTRQKNPNGDHAVASLNLKIDFVLNQNDVTLSFNITVEFNGGNETYIERAAPQSAFYNLIYQGLTWNGSSNLNNVKFGYKWI